jgi:hypothetical protein
MCSEQTEDKIFFKIVQLGLIKVGSRIYYNYRGYIHTAIVTDKGIQFFYTKDKWDFVSGWRIRKWINEIHRMHYADRRLPNTDEVWKNTWCEDMILIEYAKLLEVSIFLGNNCKPLK